MRTYLVTGGAGFIGSHLVERLIADGARVLALDDMSAGRRSNVAAVAGVPRFRLAVGSAADRPLVDRLVRSCDTVIHLAAAVGVELIRGAPSRSMLGNVTATMSVLDAATRHRRPVLLASSSEVYGYDGPIPAREDGLRSSGIPGDLRASYGVGKAFEESLAFAFAAERGLSVTVARLFNTVGPRQLADHGMVLPRFVESAAAGRPLRIFGDGRQTRCFAHVLDVAAALQALADCPDAVGTVFNVGRPEEVTILDLAARVMAAVGVRLPLELVPYADGFREARRRVPDVSRIAAVVGWTPSRDLDAIVADVVAYYGERPAAAAS